MNSSIDINGSEDVIAYGSHQKIHYLSGPTGLFGILTIEDNTETMHYVHTDYLGSYTYITDEDGQLVEVLSYDPWGRRRNAYDWTNYNVAPTLFDRGYTGHEHLDQFGLINMNGRMYDPVVSRMLAPDNFVQTPDFSQNFNRYSYALNNPLMFTDPDGEFIFTAIIPVAGIFIDAALWGAVISGAGYTASVAFSNGGFDNWNGGDFLKSMGIGAISGIATAGIGSAFGGVGGFGKEALRAGAHGILNGGLEELQGGSFGSGFLSGSLGSLAGSGFQAWGGKFAKSIYGAVSFSAVGGGIGAELGGGDFWRGAATGATIGLLNHARHIQQSNQQTRLQVKAARAFLEDLGYSSEQVAQDVVMQRDNFFSKYYAELRNFKHYSSSFTGGHLDSYSKTNDAYLSVSRELTIGKIFGVSITETFAAKYYPSRANSIGLVHTGASHWLEGGLEFIDGGIRSVTGYDNVLYNQHRTNALRYLRYR